MTENPNEEGRIRALIENWPLAMHAMDAAVAVSHYAAPDDKGKLESPMSIYRGTALESGGRSQTLA